MERVAGNRMKEIKEKPNQQQSFQERCLMLDIRMTSQRRLLASVLNESNDHPDVDTIYQRCKAKDKSTSIASIYRSLSLFEDSGLIEKLDMGDGKARFEIKRTDHDHLMDVETGQIHEFQSRELQRLIKEIADEMGFDLTEHRLEIYGRKQGRTACRCYEIKIY